MADAASEDEVITKDGLTQHERADANIHYYIDRGGLMRWNPEVETVRENPTRSNS